MTELNNNINKISSNLVCPKCSSNSSGLLERDNRLVCQICTTAYEIRDSVPRLLTDAGMKLSELELGSDIGRVMVNEYRTKVQADKKVSILSKIASVIRPPSVMYHTNPDLTEEHTKLLFNHAGDNTIVLNVGGGPRRYSDGDITLNIDDFVNVDIVADAHRLPFKDNSVDSIICIAVLEHVYDPEIVVSEMIRVLKPGGYLYAEVPFIFFFHGYPNDFKRYTLEGMRRLFSSFEAPVFGISNGPVSAVLQSTNLIFSLIIPKKLRIVRKIVNGVYRWVFFPFKYLDILVNKRPEAHILAAGFYVLATKPETDKSHGE